MRRTVTIAFDGRSLAVLRDLTAALHALARRRGRPPRNPPKADAEPVVILHAPPGIADSLGVAPGEPLTLRVLPRRDRER